MKNDGRMHVSLSGNHFQQNKVIIPNNNNVINIYCVYKIDPIASPRDDISTVQNALFGAMEITKNADTSKYKYKGYGACFDEGGTFSMGNINNGRNILIFGVDESSLIHSNNKTNIFMLWVMVLCKGLTTLNYMQKKHTVKSLLNQVKICTKFAL